MGLRYTPGKTGQMSFPEPIIVWHEGDWTLEVLGVSATKVDNEAKAVVTFLNQMLLPPHIGVGVVIVGTKGTSTSFVWQQNATQVTLATDLPTSGNARATIQMAASWHVES